MRTSKLEEPNGFDMQIEFIEELRLYLTLNWIAKEEFERQKKDGLMILSGILLDLA
jgi:hypothetical protein